jgi:WD40 repeat protein
MRPVRPGSGPGRSGFCRALLTGASDGSLKAWDFNEGTELRAFRGHRNAITCLQCDHTKMVHTPLRALSLQEGHRKRFSSPSRQTEKHPWFDSLSVPQTERH